MSSFEQEIQSIVDMYISTTPNAPPNGSAAVTETKTSSGNCNVQQTKNRPKEARNKKHMQMIEDVDVEISMLKTCFIMWVEKYKSDVISLNHLMSKLNTIHGSLIKLQARRNRLNGEIMGMNAVLDKTCIHATPLIADSI